MIDEIIFSHPERSSHRDTINLAHIKILVSQNDAQDLVRINIAYLTAYAIQMLNIDARTSCIRMTKFQHANNTEEKHSQPNGGNMEVYLNKKTISKGIQNNSPVTDINIIDQIGDALKDARRHYSRIPTNGFENLIDELEAAERLHEDDKLPHDIAIRHLQNHADYLQENGSEAKAIELRNIIEYLSIDDN